MPAPSPEHAGWGPGRGCPQARAAWPFGHKESPSFLPPAVSQMWREELQTYDLDKHRWITWITPHTKVSTGALIRWPQPGFCLCKCRREQSPLSGQAHPPQQEGRCTGTSRQPLHTLAPPRGASPQPCWEQGHSSHLAGLAISLRGKTTGVRRGLSSVSGPATLSLVGLARSQGEKGTAMSRGGVPRAAVGAGCGELRACAVSAPSAWEVIRCWDLTRSPQEPEDIKPMHAISCPRPGRGLAPLGPK